MATSGRVTRRWRAVEPEVTHFHDIIGLSFDIAGDRGISDTLGQVTIRPPSGGEWPWQRVALEFWGGDAREHRAVPVRCTFVGVVLFNFVQDDISGGYEYLDHHRRNDLYDISTLQGVPGFSVSNGTTERDYGAFCLWECPDSPLIDALVSRGAHWREIEERRPWLRHFQTTCDELGRMEVVSGDVLIERLPAPPSPS
jgi:hypothetical protein